MADRSCTLPGDILLDKYRNDTGWPYIIVGMSADYDDVMVLLNPSGNLTEIGLGADDVPPSEIGAFLHRIGLDPMRGQG